MRPTRHGFPRLKAEILVEAMPRAQWSFRSKNRVDSVESGKISEMVYLHSFSRSAFNFGYAQHRVEVSTSRSRLAMSDVHFYFGRGSFISH